MPVFPLLKVLAGAGIKSRRWMADAIRQGRVQVNGEVAENFRHPVDVEKDRISVDGKTVVLGKEELVYLMLNKPEGVLSTTGDERGRKTVMALLPEKYRRLRLYPVGRLDKDSTGLLLLTNDGEFTYRLTHPKFEHEKEYLVTLDSVLRPDEKRKLERGIELDDGKTSPAAVRSAKDFAAFGYSVIIHEGKKRQLRRMFASLGHNVRVLKRIRIGGLTLGALREGELRELSIAEAQSALKKKA